MRHLYACKGRMVDVCCVYLLSSSPAFKSKTQKVSRSMANTPRRPVNPLDAAEALFKQMKKPAAAPTEARALPGRKELVTIKLDSVIIEYFQKDGPGWQDRLNDALRDIIKARS
jgi:uncharacterized protein (DUF4415 family)